MAPLRPNFEIMPYNSSSSDSLNSCCSTTPTTTKNKQRSPCSQDSSLSATSTNNKSPEASQKKVVFKERVIIRKILHIDDYYDEEIEECWYSHEESEIFREEALALAQLAKDDGRIPLSSQENNDDSPIHCLRGLEMYTGSKQAKRRHQRKAAIRWALLKELSLQHEEGGYDADYIAELYNMASASGAAAARAIASEDESNAMW
jgi:hypothetical protein